MFKCLFILITLMFTALPTLAQTVPDPISAALEDLSNRVNRTVTLSQVAEWNYQQSVYRSPALGCPQPGIAYPDVLTSGFQFIITYAGTVYDYRVSDDKSIVVLCGTAPAPATVPPCPPANDADFLAPRLSKGIQARVVDNGLPNVIREQPGSSSTLLGQIPAGDTMIVIDGPRCTTLDKIVWWQVNYNNLIGWTGEGQSGTYWLEPANVSLTPTAPAPENVVISAANTAQLSAGESIGSPFAIAPTGTLYAWARNKDVLISDTRSIPSVATLPGEATTPTSLAFNPSATVLAIGMDNGSITFWTLQIGSSTLLLKSVTGHTAAVTTVAFSPDGTLLASGSADNTIRLWEADSGTALVTLNNEHNSPITDVRFTPDGTHLVVRLQNNVNTLFTVKTGTVG